jgi:MarR family transcriptional regulator, organic hydroperoxide resistance regulator
VHIDPLSADVHEQFMRLVHRQRLLLQRVLGGHDLHPAQAMCLRVLAHRPGIPQRDLGEALLLSPPTVTRMLQRMERRGLVERAADERDQRVAVVRLTADGRDLEAHVDRAMGEYLERSVARLPESDRRELARLLHAWCEAADVDGACVAHAPDEEEVTRA